MKCPNCNGVPYDEVWTCEVCNGKGVVEPLTNEEWLRQASTEELAWFIADVCYELQDDIWSNCEDTSCDYRQTDKNYWLKWLKEKHDGNMGKHS